MALNSWKAWRSWMPSRATSGQHWSGEWKAAWKPEGGLPLRCSGIGICVLI